MSSHPNHQPQKRARKSEEEEEEGADRISALPDELIARILALLPSTKDTIRTAVLSKRWRYLWTHVPDLFFCASEFIDSEQFVHFVNSALRFRTSSGIQKFVIDFHPRPVPEEWYSQITDWLRYATTNNVKELTLYIDPVGTSYSLPQFLYSNDSLIELNISLCYIMPKGKIDWTKLKILSIVGSRLSGDVVDIILSGSPVLESLELHVCDVINHLNITTPSLKRLVLDYIHAWGESFFLEISAPNVEDLEILGDWYGDNPSSADLLSIDVPSLISCKLDFHLHVWPGGMPDGNDGNIVKRLVEMVRHAKKLKVGSLLLKDLSKLGVECLPSQPLESKVFVLCLPDFCEDYFVGIVSLLCSLNEPEKLVIEFSDGIYNWQSPSIYESGDNYWELMSQKQDFSSVLSHLKTIEIFGLGARYKMSQTVLALVEFLIKNGKVLEKAIIYDAESFTEQNLSKMNERLLGFQRCSSHAVILFPK